MGSGAQLVRAQPYLRSSVLSSVVNQHEGPSSNSCCSACPQRTCLVNSCDSYWKGAQAKLKKDGACAVLFDENCCKASKDHLVVKKGEQGKLCGTASGFNPLSSCKGSGLK